MICSRYSITWSRTSPLRMMLQTTPLSEASIRLRFLSSPAHAQAAQRLLMHVLSLSSLATECISQTQPDAPQSGAVRQQLHPIPSTARVTVRRGPTPSLRTTQSTASECSLARTQSATPLSLRLRESSPLSRLPNHSRQQLKNILTP